MRTARVWAHEPQTTTSHSQSSAQNVGRPTLHSCGQEDRAPSPLSSIKYHRTPLEGQASRISRSFQVWVPENKCQVNESESMRASFLQPTPNHRAEDRTQVWMDENTGSPVTLTSVNS